MNNNIERLNAEFKNNKNFDEVSEISRFNDGTYVFIVYSNSGAEYLIKNRTYNGPSDTNRIVIEVELNGHRIIDDIIGFNDELGLVSISRNPLLKDYVNEITKVLEEARDVQTVVHKRLTKHQNLVVQTIPMFV